MQSLDQPPHRPLRLGMVGGGPGSNIGATHRQAARLDGRYDLVAGVFASDAARSRAFAATLGIAPERRYATWHEMAAQEAQRSDGIEVVAIMTPNNSHYAIAKAFLEQGARGLMWVSMVATGHWHGQRIRVYGEKGSLEWVQETPNELIFRPTDGPHQILARGSSYLAPEARRVSRLWTGHPEGFIDAFANIYSDIEAAILARRDRVAADPLAFTFPTVEDGVLGVKFVEAAVESNAQDGRWVSARLPQ